MLRNITAAARASSTRFTVVFSLFENAKRDTFMTAPGWKDDLRLGNFSEFVTSFSPI